LELCVALHIVIDAEVDTHESSDTARKHTFDLIATYLRIAGKSLTGGVPERTHL
jgi:hypothetical protein